MTPTQRDAALRLAESLRYFELDEIELIEAADLLCELAAEPVQEPATVKESLHVEPAQAFYKDSGAEPAYAQYARGVKDGFDLGQREARIAVKDGAANEPVQVPVAWQWLNTGTFRKRLPKTAVAENWTPLYAAPQQRKPTIELHEVRAIAGWFETLPDGAHDSQEEARFKAGQRYAASHIRAACECSVYGIKETP